MRPFEILFDEDYRRAGPTHQEATGGCARWIVISVALDLPFVHAVIMYTGCLGGWQSLVGIQSSRPDLCAVVQCFEEAAKQYPRALKNSSEGDFYEAQYAISGNAMSQLVSKVCSDLLRANERLVKKLAGLLAKNRYVYFDEIADDLLSIEKLDIHKILEDLPVSDS